MLDNIEDNDFDFWKTCTQSRTRSITSNVTSFYCLNISKWLIALKPYQQSTHACQLMPGDSIMNLINVIMMKYFEPNCNTLFIVIQMLFCKYHFYEINEMHPNSTSHSISELNQYQNGPFFPSIPWFERKLFYWSESGPKYIRIE